MEPQPMNEDDSKSYARQAEILRNDLITYKDAAQNWNTPAKMKSRARMCSIKQPAPTAPR